MILCKYGLAKGAIVIIDPITFKSINDMLKGVNFIVFVTDLAVHDDFVRIALQIGRLFLSFPIITYSSINAL